MTEPPFYERPEFWFAFAVTVFVVVVLVGALLGGHYSANETLNGPEVLA